MGLFGGGESQTTTLTLVDPVTGEVRWFYNIDSGNQYCKERSNFHSFFSDNKVIGVLFAEGFESLSDLLYESIRKAERSPPSLTIRNVKRISIPPAGAGHPLTISHPKSPSPSHVQILREQSSQSLKTNPSKSKSSGGGMWPFFGWGGKKSGSTRERITKDQIGDPTNLKHVSHVGFDSVNGFSVRNVSDKWLEILQMAGLSTQQLEDDPKLAKYTKRFLIKNYDAIAASNKADYRKVAAPSGPAADSPADTPLRATIPSAATDSAVKPAVVTEDVPRRTAAVAEDIPRQPAAVAEDIPRQPAIVAEDIPRQPAVSASAVPPPPPRRLPQKHTITIFPESPTTRPAQDSPRLQPLPRPVPQPPPPKSTGRPLQIPPQSAPSQPARSEAPPPPPPPPSILPQEKPLPQEKSHPAKTPAPALDPMAAMRGNLMESIRGSGGSSWLKTAKKDSNRPAVIPHRDNTLNSDTPDTPKFDTTTTSIAEALKDALLRRNAAVGLTDSEESESNDDMAEWS